MLILNLGDPHVMPGNIDESERMLEFVAGIARQKNVDRIVIKGDLFHTHNIVRLEVIEFWDKWLDRLTDICEVVVLTGNHDMSGSYDHKYSALSVFRRMNKPGLRIIEGPTVFGPFGYLPYIHDNEEFVKAANMLAEEGCTVLSSHTTYEGSKYESGMYCPDGIDPARIDSRFKHLFTGHIHTEQEFERVHCVGTARWLTNSDANLRKGLWLYNHADDGSVKNREFISTETVCTPIIRVEYKEGDLEQPTLSPNVKNLVHLIGSSEWISKVKVDLKGKCSISTKITDAKKSRARKSGKSLLEFMTHHYESAKKERVITYMRESKFV